MIKHFFKNRRAIYNNFGHGKWICYDKKAQNRGQYIKDKKEKINMKEKWKIIEGFPRYLISNKGRIKILSTLEDKKVFVKDDGYIATTLGNGKQNYKYVHRLVAEAFVKNKHNNHKSTI